MSGMWNVNGNGSITDSPSRSDSPAVVELMDWTAARREVADIEHLGDQDLDKLFDDIVSWLILPRNSHFQVKVRTLRGRPDSRLDMAAEMMMTASIAGESMVDPTSNPWGDGLASTGTPALMNDTDTSDTRTEGPSDPAESNSRSEGVPSVRFAAPDDLALEQQAITKQLKSLAQEVKRMRSEAAIDRAGGTPAPDVQWTPREIVLARKAADKWKKLRNFAMAEQLLTAAGDVREANIIA
jgi:kinesin family protein 1